MKHTLLNVLSRLGLASVLATLLAMSWLTVRAAPAAVVALSPDQLQSLGIELAAPESAQRALSRRYPAQVAVPVRQDHVISAPQDGTLSVLLVALGESVKAGQPLAQMQSPGLLEAQGALLEAQTRLTLSESELARDQSLFKEGLVPKRRLQATQADHDALATSVDQWGQRLALSGMSAEAIAALKAQRRLSGTLELRSPIDGVVLDQMVDTGQAVAVAAPLFRVASLSPLWLEVHVPIDQLGDIQPGDTVVLPRDEVRGRILTVGRQVHGTDQGVLVRAEVREGSDRLRPGQFVEVQLDKGGQGSGWRLPSAALIRAADAAYVFVQRPEGFAATPVKILAQEERTALVTGEINANDRVAVGGVAALKAIWLGGAE